MTIRSVRGTKDLLPEVTPHWHLLEDEARRLAHQCGYEEIRTAMFEPVELFTRGLGATAGLVERELWTFHDKHGRKLALRAELTAPVARAFHEHSLSPGPGGVFKVYYLAPVFLFGREGEMESRQVHQFGVEALGSEEPALDAECIYLAWEFCRAVGLVGMSLELNSLGCDRCRPGYHQALKDYFHGRADELCPTCKRRYKSHPLWSLGCPQPGCHALASVAPSIFAHLCAPCRSHFGSLKFYLEEMAIPYQVDLRVVRDIEYYNRTIFQLRCGERVLATGGRYDGLVEAVGGPAAPAVGMAVELEAVLECLYASGIELPQAPPLQVLLAGEGPESREVLVPMLYRLRRAGIASDLCYGSCDLDQLQVAAEKVGARLVAVLEEVEGRRRVSLYDLEAQEVERVRPEEAANRIGLLLGGKSMARLSELAELPQRRSPLRQGRRAISGEADMRGPRRSRRGERPGRPEAQPAPRPAEAPERAGRKRRRRRRRRGRDEEAARAAAGVDTPGAQGGEASPVRADDDFYEDHEPPAPPGPTVEDEAPPPPGPEEEEPAPRRRRRPQRRVREGEGPAVEGEGP